mmetsp:Transcript_10627/g.19062  ORF Transcript_10627/g.19062 Transcript_10627/m.19062 type:complete len:160 (+) Transcript_10627:1935-2414(+)
MPKGGFLATARETQAGLQNDTREEEYKEGKYKNHATSSRHLSYRKSPSIPGCRCFRPACELARLRQVQLWTQDFLNQTLTPSRNLFLTTARNGPCDFFTNSMIGYVAESGSAWNGIDLRGCKYVFKARWEVFGKGVWIKTRRALTGGVISYTLDCHHFD